MRILRVEALKADGRCYRYWTGELRHQAAGGWVVDTGPGTEICANGRVGWIQPCFIRTYFSSTQPVNLLEVSDPDGKPLEIYVNVASPTAWEAGLLRYTDYELDVVLDYSRQEKPEVIDHEEFQVAINRYRYSEELVEAVTRASQAAMDLVSNWVFNDDPARSLQRVDAMMTPPTVLRGP